MARWHCQEQALTVRWLWPISILPALLLCWASHSSSLHGSLFLSWVLTITPCSGHSPVILKSTLLPSQPFLIPNPEVCILELFLVLWRCVPTITPKTQLQKQSINLGNWSIWTWKKLNGTVDWNGCWTNFLNVYLALSGSNRSEIMHRECLRDSNSLSSMASAEECCLLKRVQRNVFGI